MTKPNMKHAGKAGYHQFASENGDYGSFEVVWLRGDETPDNGEGEHAADGWYWAAGFPGCLWDGEPCGPFNSSRAAWLDARAW